MKVLVSRFSSIGDVALTVPVLHALREQHRSLEIIMLSRPAFQSLFEPLDIVFAGADLKVRHKGLPGLQRLASELYSQYSPDKFVDLHDVLRTQILRRLLGLKGVPSVAIDKGRKEKKALTRKKNKLFKPLIHTAERYQLAFAEAGIPVKLDLHSPSLPDYRNAAADEAWEKMALAGPVIGFAPLAAHQGKAWPLNKASALLDKFAGTGIKVLLFGGPEDQSVLKMLADKRDYCMPAPGGLGFGGEVSLMKNLDLMISMDSANMHLAALAGIPVISIWGATHPYAGFSPLGQPTDRMIGQSHDELDCRPCSVFGNKPCFRGDYACLERTTPGTVFNKVQGILAS